MARRGENIYKRKDGRWEGRYKAGYDVNGKAKYRSVYAITYQAVKEKLLSLKSAPVKHEHSGRLTVKELFEEWMSAVKLKVKISTYANYRMKADKHILPAFGGIRYEKLTTKMLHTFIEDKLKSGLSAKYVSDIVIVFKSMAKYTTITHNFQNPLANVVLPKAEKKELHLLTESQQQQLCRTLMEENSKTSLCVLLSMYTGLRVGEVCALKWSDIDFEKSILTVNRTVQRIKSISSDVATIISIGKPKSRSSMRLIPLPEFFADMLNRFNQKNDSYVLSGSKKIIEPRTMQYRFKSILKKANLPSINYHALRHMFATNCIKAGFDVKTLSELLGHCSVETTLNRYVHSSMERNDTVSYLFKKLCATVEDFQAEQLIKLLCLDLEKTMYSMMLSRKRYAYDLICYPEKSGKLQQQINELNKSSLSQKFLLEYVSSQPPKGNKILGEMDYEELLAICSAIIDWANTSDLFEYKIINSEMSVLPSGRIGIDKTDIDKLAILRNNSAMSKVHNNSNPYIDTYSVDVLSLQAPDELESAFSEEFGYGFTDFIHCVMGVIALGEEIESDVKCLTKSDLYLRISKYVDLEESTVIKIVDDLSLTKRKEYLIVPKPFTKNDIWPWKFNRKLSVTRRPMVQLDEQIIWGNRQLYHCLLYTMDLINDARLPVRNVPSISSKRQNSIGVVRRTGIIAKNLLLPIAENP